MRAEKSHKVHIALMFFDSASDVPVTIGKIGFASDEEFEAAWLNVPVFRGDSSFRAEHRDENDDVVGEKTVSAETCERLMGRSVATLIAEGRTPADEQCSLNSETPSVEDFVVVDVNCSKGQVRVLRSTRGYSIEVRGLVRHEGLSAEEAIAGVAIHMSDMPMSEALSRMVLGRRLTG